MELKSDPQQFETVQVTDIDIAFPGDLQIHTLREGDTQSREDDILTVNFAAGGSIWFNLKHAHYLAIRTRSIRVPVPADRAVNEAS